MLDWYRGPARPEWIVDGLAWKINQKSLRYACFSRTVECQVCGRVGEYFLLQRDDSSLLPVAHFNLFGEEGGQPLLFTKDHIIPKSLGGRDWIGNLQTMCSRCNCSKGSGVDLSREQILQTRYLVSVPSKIKLP